MEFPAESTRARIALISCLQRFDHRSASRGLAYYRDGAIDESSFQIDEEGIFARVRGTHYYTVNLYWEGGGWELTCSCPVGLECKHTYAVARYWLDRAEGVIAPARSAPAASRPASSATPANVPKNRLTAAEQLVAQLELAHQRSLAKTEVRRIENLTKLFKDGERSYFRLSPHHFQQFGFPLSPENTDYYSVFGDWWRVTGHPRSPVELWQFIALDWKRAGREIPPLFAPITDTSRIEAQLAEEILRREMRVWQNSRPTPSATGPERQCVDLRLALTPRGAFLEFRPEPEANWKRATRPFAQHLRESRPGTYHNHLSPAAHALLLALLPALRSASFDVSRDHPLPSTAVAEILDFPATHGAIVLPDETTWREPTESLTWHALPDGARTDFYTFGLFTPEGRHVPDAELLNKEPRPLYCHENRLYTGHMPPPAKRISASALKHPQMLPLLEAHAIEPPPEIAAMIQRVTLRPRLRCWLEELSWDSEPRFCARLEAYGGEPSSVARWALAPQGWRWHEGGPEVHKRPDRIIHFDFDAADRALDTFHALGLSWSPSIDAHHGFMNASFPDRFVAWREQAPPDLEILVTTELEGLLGDPYRAHLTFNATPIDDGSGQDWFDLSVELTVDDTTLTDEERDLLLAAKGRWVRLPRLGWRRLEVRSDEASNEALDRLGFDPEQLGKAGASGSHRVHALQLVGEADFIADRDADLANRLSERLRSIQVQPPRTLPADLTAQLRPYQIEGFQFLTHLSGLGLGGILADDMGLGKTVQTLAWFLHLRGQTKAENKPFRPLVVCPKSVAHGWAQETQRFAATLKPLIFEPALTKTDETIPPDTLLIVNYTQLRLARDWFTKREWSAIVLDEAQFIKNPNSQVARTTFGLRTPHRLILTGTPIENRLADLWSLSHFAQPGLLGPKANFRRHYPDKDEAAHGRLRRRIRHFMLRRTKAQVATDLPPRTEDDLQIELEGRQRTLYDAELKRTRQMLLKIGSDREFDQERFNILASLLRLRQICCHPGLVDPAHDTLPSAKLEVLLERLAELEEEGQKVLIFSQFVSMLERVSTALTAASLPHLLLTGKTQNRAELVEQFQRAEGPPIFLLSLKAAGFGLNLTAASYVFLLDPWWNPAVEAQAIDRTHRIGQENPVVAYRLIAKDTVEEKIRALQREKAALAERIVQEESLAQVLDLESLRKILS